MRVKDNPATPGIGSGPYGSEHDLRNENTGMEFGINGMEGNNDNLAKYHMAKKSLFIMKRYRIK